MEHSQNNFELQGRRAKALYPYKAALNDELSFAIDDLITLTQASEDGTWYEGTLNDRTGWFPSNYVQVLEEEVRMENSDDQKLRIGLINEVKRVEEEFIDSLNKFLKVILIPMQCSSENILPNTMLKQIQLSIDKFIEIHSNFQQILNDIPENTDAKIGYYFINMAPNLKLVYELYAKSNPKYIQVINKQKEIMNKHFENNRHLTQTAVIYTTKSLASPFKQLENYIKLLKEIQRLTEDYHVDRGDVQRAIEFYEELSLNVQEMRKKKEYEIEIMSSRINNAEEDIFRNGESLFISSVLVVYENGEKKDRILLLFPYHLIILSNNTSKTNSTGELNFESKINLLNNSIKITRVDAQIDNFKYCFELTGSTISRLLIVCSTQYDLKSWIELLTNITNKQSQQSIQTKSQTSLKTKLGIHSDSEKSLVKTNSPVASQQQTTPTTSNTTKSVSPSQTRKLFCIRPHPPLIPHFQLPNDNITTNIDGTTTLKRFMYKKPQLSENRKYHGADDDLRLLNVIESYWKSKIRQSINVSVQDAVPSTAKTSILPQPQKIEQDHIANIKTIKINEEKILKLEAQIQSLTAELNEYKKTNKELKLITTNLQKQLESEKMIKKKLEQFIKKYNKISDLSSILNLEHESSI